MKYNSELFTINTSNKAYLLGLYYADGYVSYKPEKYKYFSGIMLAAKDEELLHEICKEFPFFAIQYDRFRPQAVSVRCNQKKFLQDLLKNGCLGNKSGKNKHLLKFPKIKKKYYFDFIRGYFDGDGAIYNVDNTTNQKRCSITSNNKLFVKEIQTILQNNNIECKLFSKDWTSEKPNIIRGQKVKFTGICYTIIISSSKENLSLLASLFYKDNALAMKRKKDAMLLYREQLSERIPCPLCNSLRTQKNGVKYLRIYCKDCNRNVSLINPFVQMKNMSCKHCQSTNTVGNGVTKSRTDGKPIAQKFICRDCKRNSSYNTAPAK